MMRANPNDKLRNLFRILGLAIVAFPFILILFLKQSRAQEYVLKKDIGRKPASVMPADDVEIAPLEQKLWINRVLVEDDAGVMRKIKNNLQKWETTDDYARNWNLSSTGLYVTPTEDQRKTYLSKQLLKYVDKRISGEVKSAEEGSALHTVGQVQEALKPNTTVEVSPLLKFRFRARVLEREARMIVENPWFEYDAQVGLDGYAVMNMRKRFDQLGLSANIVYKVSEGNWETYIDKSITQNISSRLSSTQSDNTMAFTGEADTVLSFVYSSPF